MTESSGKKKIVRASSSSSSKAGTGAKQTNDAPVWVATPEAKAQAKTARIIACVAWTIAIATEIATIIWVLPRASEQFWLLLILLIPIAVFAIVGNLQWKKANRLNPASKKNAFAFFVQNQLGAIITVIAFLPLIIFILLDKNMDGKQKAIAGGISGLALVLIATLTGIEWDGGPSQEQYAEESNIMQQLTGKDEVYWVKGGSVFHVCAEVPDVNKESADGTISVGTVAEAHAAGKDRLTKRWQSEAVKHCGYTEEEVAAVEAGLTLSIDEAPAEKPGEESPADDATEEEDAE